MQLYAEVPLRSQGETFISHNYDVECLNHQEDANFIPYDKYNELGHIACLMFPRHQKPTEKSPDQSEILSDIVPRQNTSIK